MDPNNYPYNYRPTSAPSSQYTSASSGSTPYSSHRSPASTASASIDYSYARNLSSYQSEHFNSTSPPQYREDLSVAPYPGIRQSSQHPHSSSSSSSSSSSIPARRHAGIAIQNEITGLLETLRQRRVNTLSELCRIEKKLRRQPEFAYQYQSTMGEAWTHYVQSNNLLSELRGLTRQYPFSSELLDEAKRRVYHDPQSSASWNYAWLCLLTMRDGDLVKEYAIRTAQNPVMWGNITPGQAEVSRLARLLRQQWTEAIEQMLRSWAEAPPTVDWNAYH